MSCCLSLICFTVSLCLAGLHSILITFASRLFVCRGSSFCRAQDSFTCYESRAEEESIAQLVSLGGALPRFRVDQMVGQKSQTHTVTLVRVFLSELFHPTSIRCCKGYSQLCDDRLRLTVACRSIFPPSLQRL